MAKRLPRAFGEWRVIGEIGHGGNGVVFEVTDEQTEGQFALKLLTAREETKRERFLREIEALQSVSDIEGVLPVIDSSVSDASSSEPLWYVMPKGTPALSVIESYSLIDRASFVIRIAQVVEQLHEREMAHRDIKPENFILVEDCPHLSDFGLIQLPEADALTRDGQRLGSYSTIAPEMRRWRPRVDAKPSDVFSLAKSLWILLAEENHGFEGQYSFAAQSTLRDKYPGEHLTPIDDLIRASTDPDPANRPSICEFIRALTTWSAEAVNIELRSPNQWAAIARSVFPVAVPSSARWERASDIATLLTELADQNRVHHVFFPDGGGLDLTGVRPNLETAGALELDFQGISVIIKPECLWFEGFPHAREWDYYILRCGDLPSIDNAPNHQPDRHASEYLELGSGRYADRKYYDFGEFRGEPLPSTARVVTRIDGGRFLFVHRTSVYNRVSSTYDGRHNKVSNEEFRAYIIRSIASNGEEQGSAPEEAPSSPPHLRYEDDDFSWWESESLRPKLVALTMEQYDEIMAIAVAEHEQRLRDAESSIGDLGFRVIDASRIAEFEYVPTETDNKIRLLADDEYHELVAIVEVGKDLRITNTPYVSRLYWDRKLTEARTISREYLIGRNTVAPSLQTARRLFA